MTRKGTFLTLALGVWLLPSCSESGLTGVNGSPGDHASEVTAALVVDVSGEWTWSDVSVLTLPIFVAELSGIEPEGPITHARCEASGTMTLFQSGSSFQGTAMTESQNCVTRGGQDFGSPDASLPKSVADGRIRGASLHFDFSNFLITPCPHHAVISTIEDGVAVALSGQGRCFVPGDPRYEGPLPPPPPGGGGGGTSKTLSWEAERP